MRQAAFSVVDGSHLTVEVGTSSELIGFVLAARLVSEADSSPATAHALLLALLACERGYVMRARERVYPGEVDPAHDALRELVLARMEGIR
jgi:hypothetical protein